MNHVLRFAVFNAAVQHEGPDVTVRVAALGAAHGGVFLQRHKVRKAGRRLIRRRAPGQTDGVFRPGHQGHQGGKLIADRLSRNNLQIRRQTGVQLLNKLRRGCSVLHGHLHHLPLSGHAHAQGRGEAQADMGIEAVGVFDGQMAAPKRPLHGAHQVQMTDEAQLFALFESGHHSHPLHTPFKTCKPQPLQPSRQSRVVSARRAFSYSRFRKLLEMYASI